MSLDCEHKFGFKSRENGEKYCPVCRGVLYKEDIDASIKSGGTWFGKLDGRRPDDSRIGRIRKV